MGWKEVNWIESKAIFGDVYWQNQNAQQFFSYLNRLGPGCVIYISCAHSAAAFIGNGSASSTATRSIRESPSCPLSLSISTRLTPLYNVLFVPTNRA